MLTKLSTFALLFSSVSPASLLAEDTLDDRAKAIELITVVGVNTGRNAIAGSATRISDSTLEELKYQDIQRILRLAPGINIQEEDGYGLRPNIGLRGTGVERSAKITLMEDGVLIAPAPYAAPSAYYFPTAGRLDGVEVRKGSAAIKFGPRTVGGAINLVSRKVPSWSEAFVDVKYGSTDHVTLHTVASAASEYIGIMTEWYRSSADGFKDLPNGADTGFYVSDKLLKIRVNSDDDADVFQSIEFKYSHTLGNSDETYLGLTEDDFAATPYARYAASALDRIESTHEQFSLTHKLETGALQMMTVAYRNDFARDWFKLDSLHIGGTKVKLGSVLDDPLDNALALDILRGVADSDTGAVHIKHNNRTYRAQGVQSVLAYSLNSRAVAHRIELSARYHEDYEDRLQHSENFTLQGGGLVLDSADGLGTGGNRVASADAWAFFLQDEMTIGKITLVPGVRYENITLKREDYASSDPERLGGAVKLKENSLDVVIPGLGISYQLNDTLMLMSGIFKGFNPPGTGDTAASEEVSTNLEFGVIYDNSTALIEAVGFFSDYSNILGTCSNAVGCLSGEIGDQFNGGAAHIYGLELTVSHDIDFKSNLQLVLSGNYTYTHASFRTNFTDGFWGDVIVGDKMPYLPDHQLNLRGALSGGNWSIGALMNWQSAVRTSAGQGAIIAPEKVASRTVVDLNSVLNISEMLKLYVSVDNVFDNVYVVARRPYGLRPGKPRSVSVGFKASF